MNCSPIYPCPLTRPRLNTAAPVRPVSSAARPAPSLRRTSWMPGAVLPISPSSCVGLFRSNSGPLSATASTAAMTASWCARGTASRKPAGKMISCRATGWTALHWSHCLNGVNRNSWSTRKAPQFAVSDTSAGYGISLLHSAMRLAVTLLSGHLKTGSDIHPPWFANTWPGRCAGIRCLRRLDQSGFTSAVRPCRTKSFC